VSARVSRFQVRFEVDGDGKVQAELESITKGAKQSAEAAQKAGDDWEEFGEKIGNGLKYAGAAAVAGIALIVKNTIDAEQELAQLDAVLKSTGQSASFSRDQLVAMADGIAQASTYSTGEIVKAETRLLSYSGVVGEVFPEALQIAIDQAARLGIGVEQSAETIGRALESPTKAAAALAQQGFGAAFTDSVRKSITALEEAGDAAGAQRIVLDILSESYEGAAVAARDTFGGAVDELIDTLADLLTGDTGGEGLNGARQSVEELIATLNSDDVRSGFGNLTEAAFGTINALASFVGWAEKAFEAAQHVATVELGGFQNAAGGENIGNQRAEIAQIREELKRREESGIGGALGTLALQTNALPRRIVGAQGVSGSTDSELRKRLQNLETRLQQNIDVFGDPNKQRVLVSDRDALPDGFLKPAGTPSRKAPAGDDDDKKRTKKLTDEERAAKQLEAAYERMLGSYQEQIGLFGEVGEAARVRYEIESGSLAALDPLKQQELLRLAELVDAQEAAQRVQEEGRDLTDAMRSPLEVLNAELQRHSDLLSAGAISQDTYNRAVAESEENYKRAADAAAGHFRSVDRIIADFSAGTQDRLGNDLFDAFSGNADRIEDRWKQMLIQMAAELAASKIMEYFNNSGQGGASASGGASGGGFWAGVATAIGSYFGGARATGGMTPAGGLYEVGEGGQPEMFEQNGRRFLIPGSGGNVVPASYAAAGGSGAAGPSVVNVEVINNGEPVKAQASASTQPDGSQLISMVLSAVADDVANGGRVGGAIKSRYAVQDRI
jgi:hypothetical protein